MIRKGLKGSMNINFSETYDEEDDIYYVTFKTGEPSYVMELDDILLLEVGIFSGMPTGFRILNYSKHNVGHISVHVQRMKRAVAEIKRELPVSLETRSAQLAQTLSTTLAAAAA